MKNISFFFFFSSVNFQFLEVKFSIYLNRRVFVIRKGFTKDYLLVPYIYLVMYGLS